MKRSFGAKSMKFVGVIRHYAPARPKALSGKASHHHEKARTLTDDDNFRIRAMRPGEIALAADWAAAEGWNPGDGDAACFATVDPRAFDR